MKRLTVAVSLTVLLTYGCGPKAPTSEPGYTDTWLIKTVNDTAVRNAIISQRALFPYHFVTGGAELNDLGRHDLVVLASYFKAHPGQLIIRRGKTRQALYKARVARVLDALGKVGVNRGGMRVVDSPSNGPGMPGERVVLILRAADKQIVETQQPNVNTTWGENK